MSEKEMSFSADVQGIKRYLVEPFVELGVSGEMMTLICKKETIIVNEVNIQNVLFISTELNDNILEDYKNNLDDDEQLELTVPIDTLNVYLQNLSGKAKFTLDSKKQKLNISSGMYKYGIGLKARTGNLTKFPDLEFENTINFIGENFFNVLEKSSKLNNLIDMQIKRELLDKNNFLLNISVSDDEVNNNLSVDIEKWDMSKNNIKDECSVKFDVVETDFLSVAKVTIKNSKDIVVCLKDEYPMLIEYTIAENKGKTKIILAPRVDA